MFVDQKINMDGLLWFCDFYWVFYWVNDAKLGLVGWRGRFGSDGSHGGGMISHILNRFFQHEQCGRCSTNDCEVG